MMCPFVVFSEKFQQSTYLIVLYFSYFLCDLLNNGLFDLVEKRSLL